ncbi:Thioredoxin [Phytophthora infestans]|uniref:Thioredoxin n=1 Tax=Phytophthora infestans TaxID=4787 RepID=A0A8S9UD72_PHYIN|nr:Thioredoxin [Phytophthora infestans]
MSAPTFHRSFRNLQLPSQQSKLQTETRVMIAISTAEDFHSAVAAATQKPLVACFSAPWCGGCKLVAPKVDKLAEELAETVSFARVSAEEHETLCEEVEVDSFPHFRVYRDGKIVGDYTSSKFDKVESFIRGHVAPDTVQETEETPEGEVTEETAEKDAAKEEEVSAEAATEGSKKREEREEEETNDEQVAKKAKTEEEASTEAEKAATTEPAEKVEEAATEETETAEKDSSEEKIEAAPVEKSETAGKDTAPVDAAAA